MDLNDNGFDFSYFEKYAQKVADKVGNAESGHDLEDLSEELDIPFGNLVQISEYLEKEESGKSLLHTRKS